MELVGPIDGIIDDTIYAMLNILIPAISGIECLHFHGECHICIGEFVRKVNEKLEKLEIRYRYEYTREEKVEVVKV